MVSICTDPNAKQRPQGSRQHSASSVGQSNPQSYKQSSISSGTLGRPHTPNDKRFRVQQAAAPSTLKAAATPSSPARRTIRGEGQMASMLDVDRSQTRRERTFVGGRCAACEELLEHTLAGERILQFSCGHVAHEACFYEYIKDSDSQYCPTCDAPLGLDSTRGGNILDLSKDKWIRPRVLLTCFQTSSAIWSDP